MPFFKFGTKVTFKKPLEDESRSSTKPRMRPLRFPNISFTSFMMEQSAPRTMRAGDFVEIEGTVVDILPPKETGEHRRIVVDIGDGSRQTLDSYLVESVDKPDPAEYEAFIRGVMIQDEVPSSTLTREVIDWIFRDEQVNSNKISFRLSNMGSGFKAALCDVSFHNENWFAYIGENHGDCIKELRLAHTKFDTDNLRYFRSCPRLELIDIRMCPSTCDPIFSWLGDLGCDDIYLPKMKTLICNEVRGCCCC